MVKEQRFFLCKHCGNLAGLIDDHKVKPVCCNEVMTELIPNTIDASSEKHVPVAAVFGSTVTVKVGSVSHPMESGHHIDWIYLQVNNGGQRKNIKDNKAPEAVFELAENEKAIKVFAYCNLHGLWVTDVKM